jgi:hypothetical protein
MVACLLVRPSCVFFSTLRAHALLVHPPCFLCVCVCVCVCVCMCMCMCVCSAIRFGQIGLATARGARAAAAHRGARTYTHSRLPILTLAQTHIPTYTYQTHLTTLCMQFSCLSFAIGSDFLKRSFTHLFVSHTSIVFACVLFSDMYCIRV